MTVTAPALVHAEPQDEAKANRDRDAPVRNDYPPNRRPSETSRRKTLSEDDMRRSKDETMS
jgi:hypothetical protein